ncbi:MAG: nitric oxide synthase [Anaerolineae bacterium]|nr:nitric oxide synthase [Anaerolineae bacterium]
MKALVVYDSVFGNTEEIAQVMGQALGAEAVRVGAVTTEHLTGVELLVVGSPTRAFRATPATMAWIKALPANALSGVKVAGFDTRISPEDTGSAILKTMVKLFGYAAKPILGALTKKGGQMSAPDEGFIVKASEGPLKDGELERAAAWAAKLAA